MASFSTITPGTMKVWPSGTLSGGSCGNGITYASSSSPAIPPGHLVEYTPLRTNESAWDPTKSHARHWSAIKNSGEISFTPYSRSRTVTENFVVSRPREFAAWKRHWSSCQNVCVDSFGPEKGITTYSENFDVQSWIGTPDLDSVWVSTNARLVEQVANTISSTQQAAYANALSTYDLLTTIAESKETLTYMLSKVGEAANAIKSFAQTDEQTYKMARGLSAKQLLNSSDKSFRKLGSRWMEYRYAIMPLVYTLKDVNSLLGESDFVYKSERSKSRISESVDRSEFEFPVEGTLVYMTGSFDIEVRSLVKSRYDKGALQRVLSQTAFNPFVTAWELVPYSFVVDWFANVGDAIAAHTSIDFSTQTLGCTAIKRTLVKEVRYFDNSVDRSSAKFTKNYCFPAQEFTHEFGRNLDETLQRVTVESYDRTVFTSPRFGVSFDPFLNWKRALDGVVLSYQPIKKLLRSL